MEDSKSLEIYQNIVEKELKSQREKINFPHADCHKFSHPLFHLGKSVANCPVIAIDSFKHMYSFPNFNDIHIPGKLGQFIEDLHSGKLHREFHNGPDPSQPPQIGQEIKTTEEVQTTSKVKEEIVKKEIGDDPNKAKLVVKKTDEESDKVAKQQPPESQFKKLQPSELQYS